MPETPNSPYFTLLAVVASVLSIFNIGGFLDGSDNDKVLWIILRPPSVEYMKVKNVGKLTYAYRAVEKNAMYLEPGMYVAPGVYSERRGWDFSPENFTIRPGTSKSFHPHSDVLVNI